VNGSLPNGTLTHGDLKNAQNGSVGNGHLSNGAVSNGDVHHSTKNGDVPVASGDDGLTIAKKALFHIGEGIQEKVTALVNSATMAAMSATNDNVCDFYVVNSLS
jgi:hypothetical protein